MPKERLDYLDGYADALEDLSSEMSRLEERCARAVAVLRRARQQLSVCRQERNELRKLLTDGTTTLLVERLVRAEHETEMIRRVLHEQGHNT